MAITNVYQLPQRWTPAYNPIIYSVDSDKNEELDMFYVFDLYVNGSATRNHRIKQRPNPSGVGMVDISSIMQTYINLADYSPNEVLHKNNPAGTVNYASYEGIISQVQVKVGEEYLVDGVPTLFDGSGTEGDPDYELTNVQNESYGSASYGSSVIVAPWAFTHSEMQYYMSQQNNINPYIPIFYTQNSDPYGQFMTELPRNATWNKLRTLDQTTVTMMSFWDLGLATPSIQQSIYRVYVRQYNSSGTLLTFNTAENITGNGGGPQTSAGYTTITPELKYYLLSLNITPGASFYNLSPYTAYLTVTTEVKTGTTPAYREGQPLYFYIDDDCQELYQRVRLSWLNKWGGRDYYNFTKFFQKNTDTTSDTYAQSTQNWSGFTSVQTANNSDNAKNWSVGGTKNYNRNTEVTFRIQSDWVTQDELDYLGGIPESPQVFAYTGDNQYNDEFNPTARYNQEIPYTVQITNLTYEYRLIKQQKLTQVSFDMTYTKLDKKQDIV